MNKLLMTAMTFATLISPMTWSSSQEVECRPIKDSDKKTIASLLSGADVCDEGTGGLHVIATLLEYGDILPLDIDTNTKEGRSKLSELKQLNQGIADQIKQYCKSTKSLQN